MKATVGAQELQRRWHGRLGRGGARCSIGVLCQDHLLEHRHVYLKELGGALVGVRADPVPIYPGGGSFQEQLARVDALLVPGGDDLDPKLYHGHQLHEHVDREFDDFELDCIRQVFQLRMPLLAVCRGHEVMNVAAGGSLVEDIEHDLPGSLEHCPPDALQRRNLRRHSVHPIRIEAGSRLEAILGTREAVVNSLHHMCVGAIAPGLRAIAWAPDGVVEALERIGSPWQLGVQFHPEWRELEDSLFVRFFEGLAHDGQLYRALATRNGQAPESDSDPEPA